MQTLKCYTLFNITNTGVVIRRPPINLSEEEKKIWNYNKMCQINLDTIIQVISLRTQPENISKPNELIVDFLNDTKFGFLFMAEEPKPCWTFNFTVNFDNIFNDGIHELGHLYYDCHNVPMLKTGKEWSKLPNFLDSSPELKNIHFEVINNGL